MQCGVQPAPTPAGPLAPPTVLEVLRMLEQGKMERATAELCQQYPDLRPALHREQTISEQLIANPPKTYDLPAAVVRRLAGWSVSGKLMQLKHFMLNHVSDPKDTNQTTLTVKCSEKDRKHAIRELEYLGSLVRTFFTWRAWEEASSGKTKKRTFYLTCTKVPQIETRALGDAEDRAAKLRQVLEAAAVLTDVPTSPQYVQQAEAAVLPPDGAPAPVLARPLRPLSNQLPAGRIVGVAAGKPPLGPRKKVALDVENVVVNSAKRGIGIPPATFPRAKASGTVSQRMPR